MKNILAIGSIVKINISNLDNDVMIISRVMVDNTTGRLYDYIGVLYPYGYLDPEQIILFDEEAIIEVVFEGYINKEEIDLSKQILCELENNKAD